MKFRNLGPALAAAAALLLAQALASPAWADNYTVKDSTGTTQTFCSKVATSIHYPCHVFFGLFGGAPTAVAVDGSGNVSTTVTGTVPLPTGASTAAKQPALGTAGSASSDVVTVQGAASMTPLISVGAAGTCTFTVTRPADTSAYAVGDALSDSTSAPTSGGFTCSSAARASGGSGIIVGATIVGSVDAATDLQADLVAYDSAPTAINDNAAYAPSDADAVKQVCRIPFVLSTGDTNNSSAQLDGLNCPYTTVGSANLRVLFKVTGAFTPTSAEAYTVRLKFLYTT